MPTAQTRRPPKLQRRPRKRESWTAVLQVPHNNLDSCMRLSDFLLPFEKRFRTIAIVIATATGRFQSGLNGAPNNEVEVDLGDLGCLLAAAKIDA